MLYGRYCAKRDCDDDRNGQGEHLHLERRRQAVADLRKHGLAGAERPPKVAAEHLAYPVEVLDDDRPVQTEVMPFRG